MQFHTDGHIFKVVSITGPTHNFLGLEFSEQDGETEVAIEPLTLDIKESARLSASEVQESVMKGLEMANHEIGTNYRLKRIQFVVSDSPPVEVYAQLALYIVKRLHIHPNNYNGTAE